MYNYYSLLFYIIIFIVEVDVDVVILLFIIMIIIWYLVFNYKVFWSVVRVYYNFYGEIV